MKTTSDSGNDPAIDISSHDRTDEATAAEGKADDRRGVSRSPRPSFSEATHIPFAAAVRHLWGDDTSGRVSDWIYVSSNRIHHLMFGLAPGANFRHSDDYRTIFGADEVLYVLKGILVLADPETGEVQVARPHQALFFRKDTWHHAFSFGSDALRVVEFFAPPPSTGASSAYAQTKENLVEARYSDDRWLQKLPLEADRRSQDSKISLLGDGDLVWRLDGHEGQALCGIWVSTENLTVGKILLRPGGRTAVHEHEGDETLHVLNGSLNVLVLDSADSAQSRWLEAQPDDGVYVPSRTPHQLWNVTDSEVEALFAVAPFFAERRAE